jgi:hypothetical protein
MIGKKTHNFLDSKWTTKRIRGHGFLPSGHRIAGHAWIIAWILAGLP